MVSAQFAPVHIQLIRGIGNWELGAPTEEPALGAGTSANPLARLEREQRLRQGKRLALGIRGTGNSEQADTTQALPRLRSAQVGTSRHESLSTTGLTQTTAETLILR